VHHQITYPAGAFVRVSQICTKPGKDGSPPTPGLLPISRVTWFRWVKDGKVKKGTSLSSKTTVWPVEYVLSLTGDAQPAAE
jgi:prophage regulatory protein